MKSQENCERTSWPADLREECGALGVCMLGQATEAARLLEADDFSLAANREIFSAICALVERGETTLEISLLAAELRARGVLDAVGGVPYIDDLDRGVIAERKMPSRAKVLREMAERRRLLMIADEVQRRVLDLTIPAVETIRWLRETLQ
jgi:replicative DNA helicase